ncbi:hypothetical protein [Leucobacter salsicius]|uniref:hypothetical protein n=1 Tax=Leucobacter salsicius TaxID=664638 RepID=UPI00037A126A|nr:hypothetical protein [Leucobacter salsicius]
MTIWATDPDLDLTAILSVSIAAATLVVVLIQERRHRRRAQPAVWESSVIGTVGEPDVASPNLFVSLSQHGSETIRLLGCLTYECKPLLSKELRIKSFVFRTGDTVNLEFECADPEKAWLRITWISLDDTSKVLTEWIPLMNTGPLSDKRWKQIQEEPKQRWWQKVRLPEHVLLRRVGPDHQPWRKVAATKKRRARMEILGAEIREAETNSASGALGH